MASNLDATLRRNVKLSILVASDTGNIDSDHPITPEFG